MFAQRPNSLLFQALDARANALVRPVSSFYIFLAHSHFAGTPHLRSPVNSKAAYSLYDHHHGDVGSPPCQGYNPHRQPSLLLPPL
jgi:hypothetical protein